MLAGVTEILLVDDAELKDRGKVASPYRRIVTGMWTEDGERRKWKQHEVALHCLWPQ